MFGHLQFYRRLKLSNRSWVNLSKSGASVSTKLSDNVTVNSRGRMTVRLGRGFSWRI